MDALETLALFNGVRCCTRRARASRSVQICDDGSLVTGSDGFVAVVRFGPIALVMPLGSDLGPSRYVDDGLGDRLDELVDITSHVVAVHIRHGLQKKGKGRKTSTL